MDSRVKIVLNRVVQQQRAREWLADMFVHARILLGNIREIPCLL